MIMVSLLPCSNCEHYKGIRQPEKIEKNEYISCGKIEGRSADELLERTANGKIICKYQKPIFDD